MILTFTIVFIMFVLAGMLIWPWKGEKKTCSFCMKVYIGSECPDKCARLNIKDYDTERIKDIRKENKRSETGN